MVVEEIDQGVVLFAVLMCVFGMLFLLLAIPTFLIKELRSHPGSLILACCLLEFSLYYYACFDYIHIFNRHVGKIFPFDLFQFYSDLIHISTARNIHLNENVVRAINHIFIQAILEIINLYYLCLSIDLVLIIRNPFYSPNKRVKIYHCVSLLIPICIMLPY